MITKCMMLRGGGGGGPATVAATGMPAAAAGSLTTVVNLNFTSNGHHVVAAAGDSASSTCGSEFSDSGSSASLSADELAGSGNNGPNVGAATTVVRAGNGIGGVRLVGPIVNGATSNGDLGRLMTLLEEKEDGGIGES